MSVQLPVTLYARQPIFDSELEVFGYELLFRNGNDQSANILDDDRATAQVILNAFTEIPFEHLLDGRKGFINFPRKLLQSPPPISEEQTVIEILEGVEIDDELVADVKALKESGYIIALDDYVYQTDHHELLELADIIKIDILSQGLANIPDEMEALKQYDVLFLAEKVETQKEFLQCQELGFSFFQGYFLSKPEIIKGKKIEADQNAIMRLLNVLQDQETEFKEIETVISTSPALSYKLLRLINSSAFAFPGKIDSLQKALTLLGLEKVRTWGSLLALTEMSSKPKILCSNALIRGHMSRLLAEQFHLTEVRGDGLFTAGLLSTMDAFLDLPMDKIVTSLSLPCWLNDTLLERKGNMGLILNTATFYEKAEFNNVDWNKLNQFNITPEDVQSSYHASILWAAELMEQFR